NDLVDLSRITLGRIALSRRPTDLGALVRGVVEREGAEAAARIRVTASGALEISVDPQRVEQAVMRLIDNASRFAPDGSPVDVTVAERDSEVVVSVRDRGIGIPPDRRGRIFDPFVRAHAGTTWDYGGLGVGLFLAREIAARHGGSLDYVSKEGSG